MSRFDDTPEQAEAYARGYHAGRRAERAATRAAAHAALRQLAFTLRAEEAIASSPTIAAHTRMPHLYAAIAMRRTVSEIIKRYAR